MLRRASLFSGSLITTGRFSKISLTPSMDIRMSSSSCSTSATTPSIQCESASIPQAAVTVCGAWMVSSLSCTTCVTLRPMSTVEPLVPCSLLMTAPTVSSAPVPAVEGSMISGKVLPGTGRNFSKRAFTGTCGILTPAAIILQLSMTEPPPKAMMASACVSKACLRPASMIAILGSEWMSLKIE